MSSAFFLLLSAGLIAAGVAVVWRDLDRRRRTAVSATATVSVGTHETPPISKAPPDDAGKSEGPPPTLASRLRALAQPVPPGGLTAGPLPPPQWPFLQPFTEAAVREVNGVVAAAGLVIAAPGKPCWNEDGSYGSERDVLLRGQSLASLTFSVTAGGSLKVGMSARDQSLEPDIGADATTACDGLSVAAVSEALSRCMKPAVSFATRREGRHGSRAGPALDRVLLAALKAGSGALSLAGARLVPIAAPAWEPRQRVRRLVVAVQVFGADIARMHIDLGEDEIEVAVGLPDLALMNLGRRERIPLAEVTTHTLAEAIASCAWPAIASHQAAPQPGHASRYYRH